MPGKPRLTGWLSVPAAALVLCISATAAYAIGALNPPTNVTPPVITGTAQVGQTLTCVPGAWNGTAPITYTYQWNRDGSAIAGATGTTYAAADADVGTSITCTEQATNPDGNGSATSAAVVPVAISAAPPPAAGGDTTAPALSGFKVTPRRVPLYVVLGRKGARRKARPQHKLLFKFGLSESATVVISVRHAHNAPERLIGGSWSTKLAAGDHSVRSAATVGYTRRGRYTITAQATDAAGNRSAVVKATLRVTKPHR
jgi:hypothetical protein